MMDAEVTVSSPPGVVPPSAPQPPSGQASLAAKQRDGGRRSSSSSSSSSATPAFLSNLGRATLRGIRKCPQCGVYNGTRGLSCKNKACGVSLRSEAAAAATAAGRSSKKCSVEAMRVITDSEERGTKEEGGAAGGGGGGGPGGGAQVFSVYHRGRGATAPQWGFVELVPTDTAIATGDGATLLTRINLGRCFLPYCRQGQRSSQGEAQPPGKSSDNLCVHIKQAIECRAVAAPLTLKSSVLEDLQAPMQAREELWRLATESPGPLVQRVSRDTLVVKCHTDPQHPLGLLHLTVGAGGFSSDALKSDRSVFHCACQLAAAAARRSKPGGDAAPPPPPPPPHGSASSQLCLHFYACVCAFASDDKMASEFAAFISYTSSGVQQSAPCRTVSVSEKPLQQVEPVNSHPKVKKLRLENSAGAQAVDERAVTLGFQQWLAGVTERIHHTMHYQADGKPPPLVYYVSQDFFVALQQRLSLGSKKKRLPNFTTAVAKSDGLPLGSASKYTWHITSLAQVKRVFDTPELPLEVTQSFVRNADGSYSRFRCPEPPPEPELPEGFRTERPQAIRPMELRTFLRVGPATAEQKEASPLVIEWIPDVLPRCRMGELRIGFQFGHQQSGQPDGEKAGGGGGGRSKADAGQSKLPKVDDILQVVV